MGSQIFINCGKNWFEFALKEGVLTFAGKWQKTELPDIKGFQLIGSSTYFSPSWYIFLESEVNNIPKIYIEKGVDISNTDIFAYLTHVGPLISSVDADDSLLAGELYFGKREIFDKFPNLTKIILDKLAVEIFFSVCYGRMNEVAPQSIPLVYELACKKLNWDSDHENIEKCLIRYFRERKSTVTMQVVGTSFYEWESEPKILSNLAERLEPENLVLCAEKIRNAKHEFYSNLETLVQAEPYNPADKDAIQVSLENITSKIIGNPGLEKAGYIRAQAARIIRESKKEKLNYSGRLFRVSCKAIAIQMTI